MKINKKTQYGILFSLYLARSGRTTVQVASENLGIPRTFLEQIACKLRRAGLAKSTRGPNGGYELLGDPTLLQVLSACGTYVSLLPKGERNAMTYGSTEQRALAGMIKNLQCLMQLQLNTSVRSLVHSHAARELFDLDNVSTLEA